MKKLFILILFLACLSRVKAQTYQNIGSATWQRAPTAKGYMYRINMASLGFAYWYTSSQIDSLITAHSSTYTASKGLKLNVNDFQIDTIFAQIFHSVDIKNNFKLSNISQTKTAKQLFYDPATKQVTYGDTTLASSYLLAGNNTWTGPNGWSKQVNFYDGLQTFADASLSSSIPIYANIYNLSGTGSSTILDLNTVNTSGGNLRWLISGNIPTGSTQTIYTQILSNASGVIPLIPVATGTTTDSVVTVVNGVLKKVAQSSITGTGTVTNVSSANTDIGVATGSSTPVLTLNSGAGANQIVKRDGSGNLNATTVTTNANLTGPVTSVGNATSIAATAVTPGSYTNTNLTVGADGRVTAASNGSSGSSALIPTAVKTANYTASVNDFVPIDNTSGNINVTLPTAPADKSQIGVKLITLNSAYTATLVTGGSDVFNKAGGGTTLSLKISSQGATVQYNSALGVWYVMNDDMPLAQLDARYTQTEYGNIYVRNSWTSGTLASDFSSLGVSVSSNHLAFTTTGSATYNYVTMLPRWKKSVRIIVGTKNATATQYQVGVTTGGGFSQVNYVAFDASTGASSGKITLVANSGIVATSSTAITFSAGDTLLLSCQRDQDYLTGAVTNLTTKTGYTTASYTYLSSNVTNMPNINRFFVGITSANGMTVDSIGITSTTTANANLAIVGDSKTAGAFANTVQTTYARQLANYYQNTIILAGGHNTTADILLDIPELIALKPKQVLIGGIGVNDIIGGVPTATWKANYASIISQLQIAGITVFVLDGIYDTSGSNQVYAYLHATYPSLCINTFIQGQRTPGTLSGDNVHPTQIGHDIVFSQVIAANVIKNATNNKITTLPYLQDGATNTFSSNFQTIRDSLKIGNYTAVGSNNPAFVDYGSGFSAVSGSGTSLKAKIYSNGAGNYAGLGFDASGLYNYTYAGNYRWFTGATNLATLATTGLTIGAFGNLGTNIVWGTQTGVSTATPLNLDLGGTFATTAGTLGSGKLIFFHMGGAISMITQSGTGAEYHTYSGSNHTWWINSVKMATLSTTSFTPTVPITSIAGTTTLASINIPSGVIKTSGQISGDIANVSGIPHWYDGTTDQKIAFNPLTTTGSIIYSSSGTTAAQLLVGGSGTVLHGGTTPSYSAIALSEMPIYINGTPTIVAGAGAGTSPTVSVTSNGAGLQVTVTTGTLPTGTNAVVATVTLANSLPYTPYPVFSSASAATALLNGASMIYMSSTGANNVTITSGTTALTAATTYIWNIKL